MNSSGCGGSPMATLPRSKRTRVTPFRVRTSGGTISRSPGAFGPSSAIAAGSSLDGEGDGDGVSSAAAHPASTVRRMTRSPAFPRRGRFRSASGQYRAISPFPRSTWLCIGECAGNILPARRQEHRRPDSGVPHPRQHPGDDDPVRHPGRRAHRLRSDVARLLLARHPRDALDARLCTPRSREKGRAGDRCGGGCRSGEPTPTPSPLGIERNSTFPPH